MQPDLSIYFKPLSSEIKTLFSDNANTEGKLTEKVCAYLSQEAFPEWEQAKLVIVGVKEDRLSDNLGSAQAPDNIRNYLYSLYTPTGTNNIADLGNIEAGFTISDTFFALSSVVKELVKKNKTVIVLGGTQNLTYAVYKAFESLEQIVNITSIDSGFDLGNDDKNCTNHSYLSHIILHQPSFLFNFCNLGYQTYFIPQYELQLMDKLYFDAHRLGKCQSNIEEIEPLIRNADIVSFDISSVRRSDAPGTAQSTPNGFYGEEFCQISRYAGFSDKASVIGFYEVNPSLDNNEQTSFLTAEAVWYFIDGFFNRKEEIPISGSEDFNKYRIPLNNSPEHEVVFFKSKKTARWWMSVPFPPDKKLKFERHHLVPCSYQDYLMATNNELPDRWWQTYQKLC